MFVSMWPTEDFRGVLALAEKGLSDYAIARMTGVPRSTVQYWRRHPERVREPLPPASPGWRPPDDEAYSYLLGLYLGDGHLTRLDRSPALVLTLDERYPGVIEEAARAVSLTVPGVHLGRYRCSTGAGVRLQACSGAWRYAFPQHGPGRKHSRAIELVDWQRELTRRHARPLIRGLIHSDGCRTINRFSTTLPSGRVARYEYPRYFFTNLSADIRLIFCDHCELLGVRWTQSNPRNISVSHRDSVSILDSFIGPKA